MKKGLVRLLLATTIIFGSTSYKTNIKSSYIPWINKLKAIEQEIAIKEARGCKEKAVTYQNILKENGETANMLLGWRPGFKNWHVWVCVLNKKTGLYHLMDPSFNDKDKVDGLPLVDYIDITMFYIFKENTTVEDIKKRKNYKKRFTENINEYLANKQK